MDRWGNITGWDEEKEAQARKLVDREMVRLRTSFQTAWEAGYRKFIMFLHYPPTNMMEETSPFTKIAEEYGVSAVVYSHCHGAPRFGDSIRGRFHGIPYFLVSGDYLDSDRYRSCRESGKRGCVFGSRVPPDPFK